MHRFFVMAKLFRICDKCRIFVMVKFFRHLYFTIAPARRTSHCNAILNSFQTRKHWTRKQKKMHLCKKVQA
mgnify:CR=1 FL=1